MTSWPLLKTYAGVSDSLFHLARPFTSNKALQFDHSDANALSHHPIDSYRDLREAQSSQSQIRISKQLNKRKTQIFPSLLDKANWVRSSVSNSHDVRIHF